jgi:hypothetical protein
VRKVLELKRQLGLFGRRTVSLDSIPAIVGRAEFQREARDMASRAIVMVKDSGGLVHSLKTKRQAMTLVTYGEEDARSLGNTLAGELRARGFPVTVFKLWPGSGPASYDSAAVAIERTSLALFATADRPVPWRGTIGLPSMLMELMRATARRRPTILVSLGNPYIIKDLPEVGSYLIGWRSNAVTEQAVSRALAGETSITGRLPISIPPDFPRGWGLQRQLP